MEARNSDPSERAGKSMVLSLQPPLYLLDRKYIPFIAATEGQEGLALNPQHVLTLHCCELRRMGSPGEAAWVPPPPICTVVQSTVLHTAVPPYQGFHFLQFQLPMVKSSQEADEPPSDCSVRSVVA